MLPIGYNYTALLLVILLLEALFLQRQVYSSDSFFQEILFFSQPDFLPPKDTSICLHSAYLPLLQQFLEIALAIFLANMLARDFFIKKIPCFFIKIILYGQRIFIISTVAKP